MVLQKGRHHIQLGGEKTKYKGAWERRGLEKEAPEYRKKDGWIKWACKIFRGNSHEWR